MYKKTPYSTGIGMYCIKVQIAMLSLKPISGNYGTVQCIESAANLQNIGDEDGAGNENMDHYSGHTLLSEK